MSARNILRLVVLAKAIALTTAFAQTNGAPPATPAPPPSAPAKRSAADLDKLVAPIALYPDPLIATVLPASAYPLEVVQAARFVKDTNNIAKIDAQPWDSNVKAVARFGDVIAQMNDNIQWMSDLGDAFINQPKELMDAVQRMRAKAEQAGALKTTPQQVVVATNIVETNVVGQQTVYVTNQVVQIQPAKPDVIYVPQYNPTVVYAGYPAAYPGYYYAPPYYAPGAVAAAGVVSFGVGMAVGAIAANNCDWYRGGVWGGGGDVDVNVNRNATVNRNANINNANVQNRTAQGQKWQPDQSRVRNSGSTASSAQSREARGWSSPSGQTAANARAGTGGTGAQGGTAAGQGRSTTPGSAGRPSATASGASRPSTTPSGASRPSSTPSANRAASQPAASSRTGSGASGSQSSAFSGMQNGGADRSASQRGSASRSSGGGGAARAGGGGGGGARGGGGRRG